MTPHESTRPLLALSAAGLLDPDGERQVREHVLECPECAAHLAGLAALAAGLSAMPSPRPSPELVARTQARVSAELAKRRDGVSGVVLAIAGCICGWVVSLAIWGLWDALDANPAILIWLEFSVVLAGVTAAVVVRRKRRMERSFR
jgi:anti-sigma factor RsiW